jgi:hypothetical protein
MTSIRIAVVSALAFAAVLAGGAQVNHASASPATTVTAASVQSAGQLCCDE